MPLSPAPSLLLDAVRRLDGYGQAPGVAPGRQPPGSPTRRDPSVPPRRLGEPAPPGPARPVAYVLGRHYGDWAVDGVRAVDDLVGWRAPRSCWSLVVTAAGSARRLDDRSDPDDTGTAAGAPVRVAVGVARSGETAGRLSSATSVSEDPPEGGRLLDTLRRNLELPTAPPPEGTARFLAVLWLAAALDAASTGGPLTWRAVTGLHPAARLLAARGERLRAGELEVIIAAAPSTWTWDVLRGAEVRASMAPLCPPGTASWMDTGMYARWVLAELPGPDALWRATRAHLTSDARRHLKARIHRSGVNLAREFTDPLAC